MQYVLPFVLGMAVTMVSLPVLAKLAARWMFIDQPGVRKVHSAPIPRIGGIAMALGVFAAALFAIHLQTSDLWFLAAAAVLIVFGAADDRFDLDYRIKFAGQILAVCMVVFAGGVQIQTIALNDRLWLPGWICLPLSVVFLVGVTNAVNLADGLDGLAGGTTFMSLCAVALLSRQGSTSALTLAFAGAVLGFLRFNTFPASVFMGDCGSQLLGFSVGVLSIRATQNVSTEFSAAIPILLLALPILDTLSVMTQRLAEGRSPFSPDKNHIHHKLLALGFDHHEAVIAIYVVQGALFIAAYFLRYESDALILGVVASLFVVLIGALQIAARSGWRLRSAARGAAAALPPDRLPTRRSEAISKLTYLLLAGAVATYAAVVIIKTATLAGDFRVLIITLLAVITVFATVQRAAPLALVEKAALYVTTTVLVYFDAIVQPESRWLAMLGWMAVGVAALAAALRLRLKNERRFQLTPLDLIVLFMALVVPTLTDTLRLPQGGALWIAKLVVMFYAVEMLLSRAERRAVWLRLAAGFVLVGLVVRPFTTS